jgi:molybdate transport system substrate-binding protein
MLFCCLIAGEKYQDNSILKSNERNMKIARRMCAYVTLVFFMLFALNSAADTLSVAVASNMQFVFAEIRAEFKKETGHEVLAAYNSSGKFATQIMNGAPFDVFLSADMEYPKHLYLRGFASSAPKVYAYGSLVLWSMKNIDLNQWQTLLVDDRVRKIALANPKTAPYGREAMRVLRYYKLDGKVQSKLVFGESISQANQYIYSGVVELGFTAKSVVVSPEMKGHGKWIDLPPASYQAIAQGAVILKHGKESRGALAQQFFDFLYSAKTRAILERNGFTLR